MPRKIDDRIRNSAGETYAKTDLTLQEIAKKFKVSDRTVQTWSSEDNWELQRTAHREINKPQNVVAIESARQPRENPRSIRRAHPENTLEILNDAISTLYADLGNSVGKDAAAVANSLKGLLEYREKLQPPTIEELANLVIEQLDRWQLSPRDFALHLKQRQEERNRA